MTATALLGRGSEPSDEQIDAAMAGNICRCATYDRDPKSDPPPADDGEGGR